ncbi:hemerythrin domain-containing protein [Undibacterium sp. Ren11W]|uniref:hemerythrin domain-containing protein n=1 Tax=Undibacterium sp. Ren11W TaxID=3413045 RepID=UPI003BF3E7F0
MDNLFSSAPGFDQPLAVLKHCHDRIRKQLTTLDKLLEHLPEQGADEQARQAAFAVLRYFSDAAPLHHEDEECDLLPTLEATAQGEDAALLQQLLPRILQQHAEMATLWANLERQLKAISLGVSAVLAESDIAQFKEIYFDHMHTEETQIAPMAKRIFSAAQMATLGSAMQERRGIPTQA